MKFKIKVAIVALIVGITSLNSVAKEAKEDNLILDKLSDCGLDIDRLTDGMKEDLVNMSEAELYQVCEHSLKTQELLRMQQDTINILNSIKINN